MKHKATKFKYQYPFSILLLFFFFLGYGCSKDVSSDDRFTGSWRMKKGRAHKILQIRANGTWLGEVRKEGRLGKVVTKEEEVSGTWVVADNFLHMTATKTALGDAWKVGETVAFEIIEITELLMIIKKPSGSKESWIRVKSQKVEEGEKLLRAVSMEPIVVNLSRNRPGGKNRYLCIELEFVFTPRGEGVPLPKLHPKVRETAIINLSSLAYSDVNTMDKVGKISDNLLKILNPYAKGQIESIAIKNIAVTSHWNSVEAFLSQYEEIVAEPEKNDEEQQE